MPDLPTPAFQKTDPADGQPAPVDRDKAVEAALDAADVAADKADKADAVVNDLFPDDAADISHADDEGVDDPDALFEADGATPKAPPKGWTEKTYNRFRQVIGQRNEGRKVNVKQVETIAALEKQVRGIQDKYGRFPDPDKVMAADADFMDALEQAVRVNPALSALADQVKAFQQTGSINVAPGQAPPATAAPVRPAVAEAPKTDPQVTQLLEQNARTTIGVALDSLNVKPAFQKLIADSIVANTKDNLAGIDRSGIVSAARAFIKEKGFTSAEVLSKVPAKPKGKPATGQQAQAAASTPLGAETPVGERPDAPKTRDQWLANRGKIFDAVIGGD